MSVDILAVCTGNLCRSVMAAAFLGGHLAGTDAEVLSSGFSRAGVSSPTETIAAMAGHGFDISDHRSNRVEPADVERADLVLGMDYEHCRHLTVRAPERLGHIYTLAEFVDRGEANPAEPTESLDAWLKRLHSHRPTPPHLGSRRRWEIADPYGQSARVHRRAAKRVGDLSSRAVRQLEQFLNASP